MKVVALALAAIFFLLAVLYALGLVQLGASEPGHHFKHAALFAVLGVLSLVWMRFQSASTTGAR